MFLDNITQKHSEVKDDKFTIDCFPFGTKHVNDIKDIRFRSPHAHTNINKAKETVLKLMFVVSQILQNSLTNNLFKILRMLFRNYLRLPKKKKTILFFY